MRTLITILAFAAILVPGIAHGIWTDRWEISDEPMASAMRLSQVPQSMSDWDSEELKINARQIEKAELAGFLARRYINRAGDVSFVVFLACGRPGPVSLHPPDICYPGSGYNPVSAKKNIRVDLANFPTLEFFAAEFDKPNSEKDRIRVFWSWYGKGTWQVPARPRWTFGNQPVLHKLYVIQPLHGKKQAAEETGVQFLQTLIPVLEKSLFSVDRAVPAL